MLIVYCAIAFLTLCGQLAPVRARLRAVRPPGARELTEKEQMCAALALAAAWPLLVLMLAASCILILTGHIRLEEKRA